MISLQVFLILISCSLALRIPNKSVKSVPVGYILETFSTYIDHYSPYSNKFSMRYYSNSNYWNTTKNGPIFFYCGNEGPIEVFLENSGFIDVLAQELNAVVIFAEHRYFGQSLPYGNKTFTKQSYYKYLSPHQALADYAYLLNYLKPIYNNAPVIAWGGSYGGMLSAWMRIKYPNVVNGAIASSAPINAFLGSVDPSEFNAIVTDDYADISPECPDYIANAFDYLRAAQNDPRTYYNLSIIFDTCDPVITPDDVGNLIDWIQTAFVYMAMVNYPYETDFLNPLPANPVTVACKQYDPVDVNITLDVLAATEKAASIYYDFLNTSTCNDINGSGSGNLGNLNGWDYITCSTLNIPVSSKASTSMFGDQPWNQGTVDSSCLQNWKSTPDLNYPSYYFGASSNSTWALRDVTNIVFANGSLDPWQYGSVLTSINKKLVAFVMKKAAHHLELRTPNANDPPDVAQGRLAEEAAIRNWLYSPNPN